MAVLVGGVLLQTCSTTLEHDVSLYMISTNPAGPG